MVRVFRGISSFIAILLLSSLSYSNAQRDKDSLALVALYNSTNGPNWTIKTNWLSSQPISSWFGIILVNGRVERLQIYSNNLSGPIPPETGNLTNLKTLLLDNNKLTGSIPPETGNLIKLEALYLTGNQLTGSVLKVIDFHLSVFPELKK